MNTHRLRQLQTLVGEISAEQLKYVDCFVSPDLAICLPSVGPCLYATTRDHCHPGYSFILVFDDHTRLVAQGKLITPLPGEVLAMDPGAPHHELPAEDPPRYIAVFMAPTLHDTAAAQYPAPGSAYDFQRFAPRPELLGLLKEFMGECETGLAGSESVLNAIAIRIAHSLLRAARSVTSEAPRIATRVEICRVIEHLHRQYGEKLTVEEMASVAAMSPSHFSRVFRKETGLSPLNYLIELRLAKARRLLAAGEPCITTIALRCGFASPSHFTDSFRKRFGCPPSEVQLTAMASMVASPK